MSIFTKTGIVALIHTYAFIYSLQQSYYYLHFVEEETEAKSGKSKQSKVKLLVSRQDRIKPRLSDSGPYSFSHYHNN